MSFCTLAGITINAARGSVNETRELVGSISRAFSGQARYDLRDIKRKWTLKTTPMDATVYATLVSALETSTAITMGGDLAGSVSVHARITGSQIVSAHLSGARSPDLRIVDLEIWEV